MSIDSKHPLYSEHLPDWVQMRDCFKGARAIKDKGVVYLPATAGMRADGMSSLEDEGWLAYVDYRARAHFPEVVKEAVEAMIGVMHHKPPVIELPAAMEPLRERATLGRDSLEMLLRRVNQEQILMGRVGLLLDVQKGPGKQLPHIALYYAENVINWDDSIRAPERIDSLNLVVLNETGNERSGLEWRIVQKFRMLVLGDLSENEPSGAGATYRFAVVRQGDIQPMPEAMEEASIQGRTLKRIPFVFVNAKDIVADPDDPPTLGLSNLALTIYRGEADYRQALFMQGQDTLCVIGGEQDTKYRLGAGAAINLPTTGDAKFIGVDSSGLPEMRTALENDYTRANQKAGELINETSRERESGESLRIRVAARTATLNQIAITGAFALQELLRICAEWIGANPEEVKVTPNLDFVDDKITGKDLLDIMSAKALGLPISLETIHEGMQDKGVTELTFEEEIQKIEDEKDLELVPPASTNENGPEDDPARPEGEGGPKPEQE